MRFGPRSPWCRELRRSGTWPGFGIATWAGLEEEAFTVELLVLAAEAAGGRYHLVAVRLPISLVMTPPAPGAGDGLRVAARRRTAGIVDQELADLTRPGLPPRRAGVRPRRHAQASRTSFSPPPVRHTGRW
ncbi:hypothetical protein AB0E25_30675 [Streptomyces bobili]|uniref:hypothetical protein n=1 Tax=Streptomyces bobili TaxID=67280 RepID=UPI0033CB8F30